MKKNKWVPLLGIAALLSVNGACCKSKSPRIDVKKYTESAARQTAGLYDKLMAGRRTQIPAKFPERGEPLLRLRRVDQRFLPRFAVVSVRADR